MRLTLFALIALIVAVLGYAYATNPVGCQKLLTDAFSLGTSVSTLRDELDHCAT